MPAQHTYGTVGATGGGFASWRGIQPMFAEDRLDTRPDWSWQRRSAKTWKDRNAWDSLWSFGARTSGTGGIDGDPVLMEFGHGFEPFSCDGDGNQFKNRIVGQCLDSVGSPVANAIVQGFVTATDAYVGEVTAANDGIYNLMTEQLTSTQHYLVAYKQGSPDIAGTTVNTLLPTAT
jgi:hypothetical protein